MNLDTWHPEHGIHRAVAGFARAMEQRARTAPDTIVLSGATGDLGPGPHDH